MRWASLILVFVALATQFNNCSKYAEPAFSEQSSLSLNCDADCVTPTLDNLQIKANLGGTSSEYSVPANLTEWNLGGECNEGGYKYNYIRWELHLYGQMVRHSGMAVANGGNADARCVNGRFLIYVNLASIAEDPVNRTGLSNGTNRVSYDLYIEIRAKDDPSSSVPYLANPLKARTRVYLIPI
ncbi:MAG: hypothetical protein HC902_10600 [Calothrix sp. SM1_5_4]|nr:hypothetical protein [Calothrix sp. SM1_5_4]